MRLREGAGEPRPREGRAGRNGDPSGVLLAVGWTHQSGRGPPGEETARPALCEGAAVGQVLSVGRGWRAPLQKAPGGGERGIQGIGDKQRERTEEGGHWDWKVGGSVTWWLSWGPVGILPPL